MRFDTVRRGSHVLSKSVLNSDQLVDGVTHPGEMPRPKGVIRAQQSNVTGAVCGKLIPLTAERKLERADRPNQLLACAN